MKTFRLTATVVVFLFMAWMWGCAKQAVVVPEQPAAPVAKPVEKTSPPPAETPAVKAPEAKPVEPPPIPQKPEMVSPEIPSPAAARYAVGCIFPLTGRFEDTGNKALDAALLSAGLFRRNTPLPWAVVAASSGETPEEMTKAVAYLADEAKVMAIIALSGSAEAGAAATEAQKRKVPLILITSKEGVTESGEYVFQHFLTPTQQVRALAFYAANTLNVAIFSILYPQDDYGEEMVRLFRRELQPLGGKVHKAVPYDKRQTDFTEQIKKIAGTAFKSSEKVFATPAEAKKNTSLDFEALFIPDSASRVKMIASQLAFYDVKGMYLLGTSLWNTPDLLKQNAEYLEGAVFADSFLVNGRLPETNDFVDIFYTAYRREPVNIEALVYDTMEIVLGVLEDPRIKTREDFTNLLLSVQGFRGATGSTTFRGSRIAQKDAFILKVINGKIEQVR